MSHSAIYVSDTVVFFHDCYNKGKEGVIIRDRKGEKEVKTSIEALTYFVSRDKMGLPHNTLYHDNFFSKKENLVEIKKLSDNNSLTVPIEDLKDFVAEAMKFEIILKLEQATPNEIITFYNLSKILGDRNG